MKNLTYVRGSTGKSLFSAALMDYHRKTFQGVQMMLMEEGPLSPDVGRLYTNKEGVIVHGVTLNEQNEGWADMVDAIEETGAEHIIINSNAASYLGIQVQGAFFEECLESLGVALKVFWILNRNINSVVLLREFLSISKKTLCIRFSIYTLEKMENSPTVTIMICTKK